MVDKADRYVVWAVEDDGKETTVWDGMALNEFDAMGFAVVEHPELKGKKLKAKWADFIPKEGDTATTTLGEMVTEAGKGKKSRKPRSDQGKPHNKAADKPKPKERRKRVYHLAECIVQTFESKQALDEHLSGCAPDVHMATFTVIDGGTLRKIEPHTTYLLPKV